MDFSWIHDRARLLQTFQSKLRAHRLASRKAQSAAQAVKLGPLRYAKGTALLITSLTLGWLTHTSIEAQSIEHYLETHWPSPTVIQSTLSSLGYFPLHDRATQIRLLQSLALEIGSTPAIWASEDSCLIYIPPSASSLPVELWSCDPKPLAPRQWRRLGPGLKGLQNIHQSPLKAPKSIKKVGNPIDPLEIRY